MSGGVVPAQSHWVSWHGNDVTQEQLDDLLKARICSFGEHTKCQWPYLVANSKTMSDAATTALLPGPVLLFLRCACCLTKRMVARAGDGAFPLIGWLGMRLYSFSILCTVLKHYRCHRKYASEQLRVFCAHHLVW